MKHPVNVLAGKNKTQPEIYKLCVELYTFKSVFNIIL